MKKKVYLHLGYPKTGTTSLQSYFFPEVCEVNGWLYFGKRYDANGTTNLSSSVKDFIDIIRFSDEKTLRERRSEIIEQYFGEAHETIIFSAETFIFDSFRYKIVKGKLTTLNLTKSLKNLSVIFCEGPEFDTRVILALRAQRQLIPSLYAEVYMDFYRKIPELCTPTRFVSASLNGGGGLFSSGAFNYLNVVDELSALFGDDRVVMLMYEHMKQNPSHYFDGLLDILGSRSYIPANKETNVRGTPSGWKSKKLTVAEILRPFGRVVQRGVSVSPHFRKNIKSLLSKLQIRRPVELDICDEDKEKIELHYGASNKQLAERYKLPLEELGYW